jgi:hypothetical protein
VVSCCGPWCAESNAAETTAAIHRSRLSLLVVVRILRQRSAAAACGARRIADPGALARLCGSSATLEAVGKRMRCSNCGKKIAEVVAVRGRGRAGGARTRKRRPRPALSLEWGPAAFRRRRAVSRSSQSGPEATERRTIARYIAWRGSSGHSPRITTQEGQDGGREVKPGRHGGRGGVS